MNHQHDGREHLIVAFVDDLMSATRIESVAVQLGYQVKNVGRASMLGVALDVDSLNRPGEPVEGPLATLMEALTAWQPCLLVFDLANPAIPWRQWLSILKSSPATRRVPVICYGPHVDKQSLNDAANMTTEPDAVVPRSRFFAAMPDLIATVARVYDYPAIAEGCLGSLPSSALQGLVAFNASHYFDAHEHLEDAWNEERGPVRELYRALLQVAVAYLQIERRNYRGAVKMFLRARQWLAPLPAQCRGVDVARLRVDAERVYQAITDLGPERLDRFDLAALSPVHYVDHHHTIGRSGGGEDLK